MFRALSTSCARTLDSVYSLAVEFPAKKLVIGTANFGSNYGINNNGIREGDVFKIVNDTILREDIFIETGENYHGSEELIGNILDSRRFKNFIVKVSPRHFSSKKSFLKSVEGSLKRLRQDSAFAIMLHGLGDSLKESTDSVKSALKTVLAQGLTNRVGLSCYEISEVLYARKQFPEMTIFQLPENIVDRRKQNSEELRDLANSGVMFQVRSIFLQGLLVNKAINLPTELQEIELIRLEIESLANRHGLDSSELCLSYAQSLDWASQLVLGFDSYEQFRKNLSSIERIDPNISFDIPQASDFLTDPRNWS
jgi:aryl-alcohol dehydrogenase-like predicted oxidoreductase